MTLVPLIHENPLIAWAFERNTKRLQFKLHLEVEIITFFSNIFLSRKNFFWGAGKHIK